MTSDRYDQLMLEAARSGDREALSSLLIIAQPDIRRYARRACLASDIDDAVQETLWLIHNNLGTLRALSSFSGWLMTIVKRECLRLSKKMFGQNTDISEIEDDARFAYRSQDDLRLDLVHAMQSLPQHYREVILLRDMEELSIEDITITLKLTRQTVKARIHRARLMMREYLSN